MFNHASTQSLHAFFMTSTPSQSALYSCTLDGGDGARSPVSITPRQPAVFTAACLLSRWTTGGQWTVDSGRWTVDPRGQSVVRRRRPSGRPRPFVMASCCDAGLASLLSLFPSVARVIYLAGPQEKIGEGHGDGRHKNGHGLEAVRSAPGSYLVCSAFR